MTPRVPLALALVPLGVGLAIYWWAWRGQADAFRAEVAAVVDAPLALSGFPYRLQADAAALDVARAGEGARVRVTADATEFDRQPWRPNPTVVRLTGPRLEAAAPPIAGAALTVTAPSALASVNVADNRLARLSMVFDSPRVAFRLLPGPLTATSLELHVRETPQVLDVASRAATYPEQAQLVVSGTAVRLGEGTPLKLDAALGLTARGAVRAFATWRDGGTVEVRRLTLADATGEVLSLTATLAPGAAGRLAIAGTVSTVCPFTLAAALAGRMAEPEKRARTPRKLAITGLATAPTLVLPPEGLTRRPVRAQQPDCPRLR